MTETTFHNPTVITRYLLDNIVSFLVILLIIFILVNSIIYLPFVMSGGFRTPILICILSPFTDYKYKTVGVIPLSSRVLVST